MAAQDRGQHVAGGAPDVDDGLEPREVVGGGDRRRLRSVEADHRLAEERRLVGMLREVIEGRHPEHLLERGLAGLERIEDLVPGAVEGRARQRQDGGERRARRAGLRASRRAASARSAVRRARSGCRGTRACASAGAATARACRFPRRARRRSSALPRACPPARASRPRRRRARPSSPSPSGSPACAAGGAVRGRLRTRLRPGLVSALTAAPLCFSRSHGPRPSPARRR